MQTTTTPWDVARYLRAATPTLEIAGVDYGCSLNDAIAQAPYIVKVSSTEDDSDDDDDDEDEDTLFSCYLCQRCDVDSKTMRKHLMDPIHMDSVKNLRSNIVHASHVLLRWNFVQNKMRKRLENSNQIYKASWRDACKAAVFDFLTSDDDYASNPLLSSDDEGYMEQQCNYRPMLTVLRQHQLYERMALLELAVWKAMCLLQMPPVKDYRAAQDWLVSGWKSCKAQHYRTNEIDIVLQNVLPFIELHKE